MMSAREIRALILNVIQPMKVGKTVEQKGTQASLDNLYPDGFNDKFRLASPFGFIAKIPKGVTAFYDALYGSQHENIITSLMHTQRPEPSAPGEVVLYSTGADGAAVQVKFVLSNDGTLTVTAPTKVIVNSPMVEVGAGTLEKILNGETFRTQFLLHTHEGNLGVPTGPVIQPFVESEVLSSVVKAAK